MENNIFEKKDVLYSSTMGIVVVKDVTKLSPDKSAPIPYYVLCSLADKDKVAYIPVENHEVELKFLLNKDQAMKAKAWSGSLCECAGFDEEYAKVFWDRLTNNPGVFMEYVYYMLHQDFACEYKIEGITLVDIMVWQLDHFKASMDMDREQKKNPDLMLLTAFVSMLDMADDPEKFIERMKSDTGTDYPGKY